MKLLRNYIIVLSVVAVVSVTLAVLSVGGYLTRGDLAVLSPADPMTVNPAEEGDQELADLFSKVMKRATLLDEAPQIPESTHTVTLQTRTDGGIWVGAYSLSVIRMIDRYAVVKDLTDGAYYRLSFGGFETLLSHEAFQDLPAQRYSAPSLSLKGDLWTESLSLMPNSEQLHLFTAMGIAKEWNRQDASISHEVHLTVEQASQLPEILGENLPDAWSLTLKKGEEKILTQDRVKASELAFPQESGDYSCTLTAHWNLSPEQDWYGDLNYALTIHIAEPQPPQDLPEDTE